MKKIITFLAITTMLFACSKTELMEPLDPENDQEINFRGKKGGDGGSAMTVTTDEATYILPFGAISGGSISSSGGGNNVTERGVCFSINPTPTINDQTVPSGSGPGTFTSIISWLDSGTTYYIRAYAMKTNNKGTTVTYGQEVSFETPLPEYGDNVTDIDGNIYTTIKIGTQWWMIENLKTTKYRDGTSIPNVTDGTEWSNLTNGAYCDYDNNPDNSSAYGRLYNSDAASNSLIAPEGWHTPSLGEFFTLANYLGEDGIGGGRMKEAGFTHWSSPNTDGDNSSGFTAVGAGIRAAYDGAFHNLGIRNSFWTSYDGYQMFTLNHDSGSWGYAWGSCDPTPSCYNYGASIRLIKD